jgi:hypothetical protein
MIRLLFSVLLAAAPTQSRATRLSSFIAREAPRCWGRGCWSQAKRSAFSVQFVKRVDVEAKRQRLDPVALVVVAWIESGFVPWARRVEGDGTTSIGLYQTIRGDHFPQLAWRGLQGCTPGPRVRSYWRLWWQRQPAGKCRAQDVANRRRRLGRWSIRELRDPWISTYVGALEIRGHLDSAQKRRRRSPNHRACRGLPSMLPRYAFFNSGNGHVRRGYVWKLCSRYRKLTKLLTR